MAKRLLNISEASEYLGVAEKTLYHWVSQRRIPFVKLSHKVLRFDPARIDKWVEKNTVDTVRAVDFMGDRVYNMIKENGNGSIQKQERRCLLG
jgi:excisionase family DNA binding protein